MVYFQNQCDTMAFGKSCMARMIAPLFGITGSVCVCVYPIPLVHGGSVAG